MCEATLDLSNHLQHMQAPPLPLVSDFCHQVADWLQKDPQNIAVVHCKAGKGRTGTMICCYLVYGVCLLRVLFSIVCCLQLVIYLATHSRPHSHQAQRKQQLCLEVANHAMCSTHALLTCTSNVLGNV